MDDSAAPRERNTITNSDEIKKKDMILDDLIGILTEMLDISPTDISLETNISEELDMDSLQIYELVIDLEEAYDIRLPDNIIEKVDTVGDAVSMIYRILEKQ